MQYYVSYIESKGHAAMILSVQKSPNEPVEVLHEFGFRPAAVHGVVDVVPGVVGEEHNVGRALYNESSHVQHRTYPISEAEFKKCLAKLNSDKRQNVEKRDQE